MKSFLAAAALLVAGGLPVFGKPDMPKEMPDFEVRPAVNVGPDDLTRVDGKHDWKSWLEAKFPDASGTWPKEAESAFAALRGNQAWDYVGKGDFDRDGAPTAVFVKVEKLPKSKKAFPRRLVVAKWLKGRWTPLLSLDGGKSARMNGRTMPDFSQPRFYAYTVSFFIGNPDEMAHPGAHISVNFVSREGLVLAEPISFCFLPEKAKYASIEGDGDWSTD